MKFPGQSTFRDDEAASMKASRQGNALAPPGGCNDGACGRALRGPRSLSISACGARMDSSCVARPIGMECARGLGLSTSQCVNVNTTDATAGATSEDFDLVCLFGLVQCTSDIPRWSRDTGRNPIKKTPGGAGTHRLNKGATDLRYSTVR